MRRFYSGNIFVDVNFKSCAWISQEPKALMSIWVNLPDSRQGGPYGYSDRKLPDGGVWSCVWNTLTFSWLCGQITYFHEVVFTLLRNERGLVSLHIKGNSNRIFLTLHYLFFLVFACLGFLSPANRGALMTCAVVLWVLLGTPAGYVAARFYKCK